MILGETIRKLKKNGEKGCNKAGINNMENNKKLNYFFKSCNKINYEHKIHSIGNEKKAMTRDAMKVKKKNH